MDIDTLYLFLLGLALVAVGAYLFVCYRLYKSKKIIGPMTFLFLGMAISTLCGFLAFFGTDSTKGWNPYGWWYPATFLASVFGAVAAVLIYGLILKKGRRANKNSANR